MPYNLHPLSFSETLDRAFRVYVDNFLLLFGISAIVWLPIAILAASTAIFGNRTTSILNLILVTGIGPVMQAALAIAVSEVYVGGPITVVKAYQATCRIIPYVVGTYILMSLPFFLAGLVFSLGLVASRPIVAVALAGMFPVAIVILGYFVVSCSLIGPVMVIERRFGVAALRRSGKLVIGSWWRTAGVLLAAGLIAAVPGSALKLVWGFVPFFGAVLAGATHAVTSTYGAVVVMIYYFDRRCRTEEFDLLTLAEQIRDESALSTFEFQTRLGNGRYSKSLYDL